MSDFLGRALGAGLLTRASGATELILVRHGQQIRAGKDSPESLAYDAPLSETGQAQAKAVGDALAGGEIDAVYTSDLSRAKDTGAAIAGHHGLEIVVDERVREIGIFRDVPKDVSFEAAVGPEAAEQAKQRMIDTLTWDSIPLSEGSAEFRTRVHTAIWEIVRRHPGQRIAVACHGGVINGFLAQEYGLARDFVFRPAHAGITRVRCSEDRAIILTANAIDHLEPAGLLTF